MSTMAGPAMARVSRCCELSSASTARKAIAYNQSPGVPFDRSNNPYRGCNHGCIHCFTHPTHAYSGLSPGLDFETKLFQKHDAPERLPEKFRRPNYCSDFIALSANTDP